MPLNTLRLNLPLLASLFALSACGDSADVTPWSLSELANEESWIITQIPAEPTPRSDHSFGNVIYTAGNTLGVREKLVLALGGATQPVSSLQRSMISYIWTGEGATQQPLLCSNSYELMVVGLFSQSEDVIKLHPRGDRTRIEPLAPGEASMASMGSLFMRGDRIDASHHPPSAICDTLFEEPSQPIGVGASLDVSVVQVAGLAFSKGAPWPQGAHSSFSDDPRMVGPTSCPAQPNPSVIRVVEGESATLGYRLVDATGEAIDAANWTQAEPLTLRQRDVSPKLTSYSNRSGRLFFTSEEGTGAAYLRSAWGDEITIEILDRSQVQDVGVFFYAADRFGGPILSGGVLPEGSREVFIGQGAIVLQDGSLPCNTKQRFETLVETPEVCKILSDRDSRGANIPHTSHTVRFQQAGRCVFEMSWPGTSVPTKRIELTAQ
jgi:hypothetical protein